MAVTMKNTVFCRLTPSFKAEIKITIFLQNDLFH
jgi:hypothetical protein